MKRRYLIVIVILFFALHVSAQGDVVVHTDPRLSVLLKKKRVVMQASVTRPAARQQAETRVAGNLPHSGPEPVAVTVAPAHSAAETTHPTPIPVSAAPVVALPPRFVREKEGRVIYSGKGFRVQIYSGGDREKAIMIKTEFMRHFPGVRTYLTYISPSFRVKVGNYRHRSDAMGMLKEANSMYSPSVIVPDIITINTF